MRRILGVGHTLPARKLRCVRVERKSEGGTRKRRGNPLSVPHGFTCEIHNARHLPTHMSHIDPQLAAALESRYRLERPLGEGGMATVYLAEDLKHQRRVAVKVLKQDVAEAIGAERFLREITMTANLRHPHILPLFDSGEADGRLFYVMPYVEGETLHDRIAREGALAVDDALRIADEVADALHYAHTRGVIHRDIKPENILLENDHAVVADFGIAHAVSTAGDSKLTMVGMALGTPHYMSPAQGTGDVIDARSDLYALGCVTYEMLAGKPPYNAPTPVSLMMKHVLEPIPSLEKVRSGLAPAIVAAVAQALAKAPPVFATELLGRDEQLAAAIASLRAGARVLSITGYGGTGKTRCASALQRRVASEYQGGTAFVSFASLTNAAEVMSSLAGALDIAEAHGRQPIDAVATLIGDRRVLLVLDNLEQVIEAAEDIATLIAQCPALQVVATSRRPLRISAEQECALPPLELPATNATVEAMRACPSVVLFVQRAQKASPPFAITENNADSVAEICRRLDGLPLALELAAARIRMLEPSALLLRLDHALDLLTSGDRDLPLRQRTLRATISWSYSLLERYEQRLLQQMSVFHEGWTLEGMEHVCYSENDRWRALGDLGSLVEKGLVRVIGHGERYGLLETIRAFAAEQLHASGQVDAIRDAHADYILALAEVVNAGIQGTTQREAMQRAKADNANFFAAITRLTARAKHGDAEGIEKGLLLCGLLGWYWHIVGLHLVAHDTVHALLAMVKDAPPSRGRALAQFTYGIVLASTGELAASIIATNGTAADGKAIGDATLYGLGRGCAGYAMLGLGQLEEAGPFFDEAIASVVVAENEFLHAVLLAFKGMQQYVTGKLEVGIETIEQARRIQVRIGDCEGGGVALSFLAQMHFAKGDITRATKLYHESELELGIVGDKPELARVQGELGWVALADADLVEARRNFQRALRTNDEIGSPRGIGQAVYGLAATEAAAGNSARAVAIAAAAQVMSERTGVVIEHTMAPGLAERIESLRASIPDEDLVKLVEQGRTLTPAAVLAMAAA